MKNHYVMNRHGKMLFRGTLKECEVYCERVTKQWRDIGRIQMAPLLKVYYDTATEPTTVFNKESNA